MRAYPDAYLSYLAHFHGDRDWFECHELLEEHWKSQPDDVYSRTWVGLIQIAVGLYHERRGNKAGARKMLGAALRNVNKEQLNELGLDGSETVRRVHARLDELERAEGAPFRDLNLPIADAELLARCKQLTSRMGTAWEAPSRIDDPELIHRHSRRDRSEVIQARLVEAEKRRVSRAGRGGVNG